MSCMIKTHYLQLTAFIRGSKVDIASTLYDWESLLTSGQNARIFLLSKVSELYVGSA